MRAAPFVAAPRLRGAPRDRGREMPSRGEARGRPPRPLRTRRQAAPPRRWHPRPRRPAGGRRPRRHRRACGSGNAGPGERVRVDDALGRRVADRERPPCPDAHAEVARLVGRRAAEGRVEPDVDEDLQQGSAVITPIRARMARRAGWRAAPAVARGSASSKPASALRAAPSRRAAASRRRRRACAAGRAPPASTQRIAGPASRRTRSLPV